MKLQMRYVVEIKVAVSGTKKLGGGMNSMNNTVKVKRKAWKQWNSGGSKEEYLKAKRAAKTAVYFAKKDAQTEQFADSDKNRIFKMAKRLK